MANPSRCHVPDPIRALAARDLQLEAGLICIRWIASHASVEDREAINALAESVAWSRLMCWSLLFSDEETRSLLLAIDEQEDDEAGALLP